MSAIYIQRNPQIKLGLRRSLVGKAAVYFLAGLLLGASSAQAQPGPMPFGDPSCHGLMTADLDALRGLMDDAVNGSLTTGCAILLAHEGEIVFREARGDLVMDDLYAIASVTKSLSATGVAMAEDQGYLTLNQPLSDFVPAFADVRVGDPVSGPPPIRPPTVLDTVSNQSGITPNYDQEEKDFCESLAASVDITATNALALDPGNWLYSSKAFGVGDRCVEVATGLPFTRFIQEQLFDELGMSNTFFDEPWFNPNPDPDPPPCFPYDPDVIGKFIMGGGGLWSTMDDLAIFADMHRRDGEYHGVRVMSVAAAQGMRDFQIASTDTPWLIGSDYGMGWWMEREVSGEYQTITGAGSFGDQIGVDLDIDVTGVAFTQSTSYADMESWLRDVQLTARGFSWVADACSAGDMNCDDVLDVNDVEPFVQALIDPAAYDLAYPDCDANRIDVNEDTSNDALDIQAFVTALLGS